VRTHFASHARMDRETTSGSIGSVREKEIAPRPGLNDPNRRAGISAEKGEWSVSSSYFGLLFPTSFSMVA
jgi:hypothetical protein